MVKMIEPLLVDGPVGNLNFQSQTLNFHRQNSDDEDEIATRNVGLLELPDAPFTPSNRGCGVGTQRLRLRLLHKSSVCINKGKPVRHFITAT
jgi:hypothetical protein